MVKGFLCSIRHFEGIRLLLFRFIAESFLLCKYNYTTYAKRYNIDIQFWGIFPFVATLLKGRFFILFTVAFLLFLALAGGSNPAGPNA